MIWKILSLGKLALMSMIFLVPQALRRKFSLMILYLLYLMMRIIMYFVEFAPTTTNKIDYAYVGSSNYFMHETHDKNALCDSYIVEFAHVSTESYYERVKYGCKIFHVTKTPLYVLKFLKLHLFYLPMLVTLLFMNLFIYKIPFHRKHVRLKCVLNLPLDALFCFKYYFLRVHH